MLAREVEGKQGKPGSEETRPVDESEQVDTVSELSQAPESSRQI
jgi:hypothetical protein